MRPRLALLAVSLACTIPACRGKSPTASTSTSTAAENASPSASSSTPVPEAPTAPGAFTAKLVRCGWGPVDANAGADAIPWAIALVDVELPAAVRGLHVSALELSSDTGIATKMGERATLRVQEGELGFSYAAAGTRELGDTLDAGTFRLRAAAALDRHRKQIGALKPTTCSVALTDATDRTLVAKGNADPEWQNE